MKSDLPKVLHPLLGVPMLAWPLRQVQALGADPVVVVVGHGADLVRAAFSSAGPAVRFVLQAEQLGTGHAALQAQEALEGFAGDVLILPGDAPLITRATLEKLREFHQSKGATLTVLTTKLADPAHYGRIVRSPDGRLDRIVEFKDADPATRAIPEINSGIYLVKGPFLFQALRRVRNNNAQREYYLTDIVALAREEGVPLEAWCYERSVELAGVNDRAELAEAESVLAAALQQKWMKAGVSIQSPTTVRIEADVELGEDCCLAPGVQLLGRTRLETGCRLEAGVHLRDVQVGARASVGPYAVLEACTIPEGTAIPAGHRGRLEG